MGRPLSDLRANPTTSRPEHIETVCLKPDLVARVVDLTAKLSTPEVPQADDEAPAAPPEKLGAGAERAKARDEREAVRTELTAALAEMQREEGDLTLRATEDGAWRIWCNAHPARKEGEPGRERDLEVARGYCNADDLILDLGTYAYAWDGDRLADGDWKLLSENIGGYDKKRLAAAVVNMFESRLDFVNWRRGLQATLTAWPSFDSPEPSESAPADS